MRNLINKILDYFQEKREIYIYNHTQHVFKLGYDNNYHLTGNK